MNKPIVVSSSIFLAACMFMYMSSPKELSSQQPNPIIIVASDPSGNCPARRLALSSASGNPFYCNPESGTWSQFASSGTVVSAAWPYNVFGGTSYVAATGNAATKPPASGSTSFINSVNPTTLESGTNGDLVFGGTGVYWLKESGSASVDAEFTFSPVGSANAFPGTGIYLCDVTNGEIWALYVFYPTGTDAAQQQIGLDHYSSSSCTATPGSGATSWGKYQWTNIAPDSHLKLSVSSGTLTAQAYFGSTPITLTTETGLGTMSIGGVFMNSNGTPNYIDVTSLKVQ